MGAYYTKEDITGYISRNTVIPVPVRRRTKGVPGPPSGLTAACGACCRTTPTAISTRPSATELRGTRVSPGIQPVSTRPSSCRTRSRPESTYVSQRGGWNLAAPDDYALPTETWREVVARRQRHTEVHGKLASGEVQEINDLITLNLDIEQFAKDVIAQSEGPELLRAFWHAMRDVSVLDPTCGSGAFLFAALNILEPLYTACLEGMQRLCGRPAERIRVGPTAPRHPQRLQGRSWNEVDGHPSERYFILKSIVLNNLYGVDIMEEAVEICKLRLFLKLVAQLKTYDQIEPLPDIDFNIRAGNTLVGFTSLDAVRQAMTMMPNGQHRQAMFAEDRATLARIEEEPAETCQTGRSTSSDGSRPCSAER